MGYDEYYKFETAMEANEKDWRQTREIQKMIERIGDLYGAVEEKFDSEGIFERLPNATYKFYDSDGETDYGLRLYCIRVNNEAVILLNGARKTTQTRGISLIVAHILILQKNWQKLFMTLNLPN